MLDLLEFIEMKIEEIKRAMHQRPFQPFIVHIADGGALLVEHEDFVSVSKTGRKLVIFQGEDYHVLNPTMITRLQVPGSEKPAK